MEFQRMETEKDTKLDALEWALQFMREYEKKLKQKALQIIKRQRKDKQHGHIRQTYLSKSQR